MKVRPTFLALALALIASLSTATQAAVVSVDLPTDGSWQTFTVDDWLGEPGLAWKNTDGDALSFHFVVPNGSLAHVQVVDLGFAGDSFNFTASGSAYLPTGTLDVATVNYTPELAVVMDPQQALANPAYSRGSVDLSAGDWSLTGVLRQSVLLDGQALNSTAGAISVTLSPVPEPATALSLLAGLGLIGATLRRRAR